MKINPVYSTRDSYSILVTLLFFLTILTRIFFSFTHIVSIKNKIKKMIKLVQSQKFFFRFSHTAL